MTHDNENADLSDLSTLGFTTRAIHAGQEPDPRTGAVVPAIYQTSTYKQDGVGGLREGYEYSRSANPTRTALEECIAALEGGAKGFAFASGLAGSDTVIRSILRPGEHMVIPTDAYGGTYRLVDKVTKSWGVEYSTAPIADVDAVRAAVTDKTKLIWVETRAATPTSSGERSSSRRTSACPSSRTPRRASASTRTRSAPSPVRSTAG